MGTPPIERAFLHVKECIRARMMHELNSTGADPLRAAERAVADLQRARRAAETLRDIALRPDAE